jgi:hypothetical protein
MGDGDDKGRYSMASCGRAGQSRGAFCPTSCRRCVRHAGKAVLCISWAFWSPRYMLASRMRTLLHHTHTHTHTHTRKPLLTNVPLSAVTHFNNYCAHCVRALSYEGNVLSVSKETQEYSKIRYQGAKIGLYKTGVYRQARAHSLTIIHLLVS